MEGKEDLYPQKTNKYNLTPLDACDQYQQRFMIPVVEVICHRGKLLSLSGKKKKKSSLADLWTAHRNTTTLININTSQEMLQHFMALV